MKESKPVTALIVKEDGLIYVSEVPEEPHCLINYVTNLDYPQQNRDYKKALTSAKQSAILVSDQEKAEELLYDHIEANIDRLVRKRPNIKPGIYPIPDLKWEVEERWKHGINSYMPITVKVAILKESPKPESKLGFDLEYDLQVLKEDMTDLFDENGKRYAGVNLSNRQAELMYNMIIRLETKINNESDYF